MPRWFLALVFIAGVGLLYVGYRVGKEPVRPNVVFLLLDTLRADRLNGTRNGIPITPFLSEYAKGGTNYTRAISPCSWTKPTMASLFTVTYPDTHHVQFSLEPGEKDTKSDVLSAGFETLAEYFATAGYDTWGYQTNGNVTPYFGFSQGFAEGHYLMLGLAPAKKVTTDILNNLGNLKPPFMLFAQYTDPHLPYTPPDEYREIFGASPQPSADEAKIIASDNETFLKYFYDDLNTWLGRQQARTMPALGLDAKESIRYRYDAECRSMDDQLAKLVRSIESLYPNTIVVIVSDHGEEFWERGTIGHGHTLYQELVHVPLILRGPGIAPGVVEATVNTMGILPTLAKLTGLPVREQWQVPDLPTQVQEGKPVYTWTRASHRGDNVHAEAVLDGKDKFIEDLAHKKTELFDLMADPTEQKNLHPQAISDKLAQSMERHRVVTVEDGKKVTSTSATLTEDQKQQLERLGYGKVKKDQESAPPTGTLNTGAISPTPSATP